MKNTHPVRHVLLLIFSFLFLFCFPAKHLSAADNKIIILKETAEKKELAIPGIGIKRAFLYDDKDGLLIIEVDKQGPLRWMMHDTWMISVTWQAHSIRLSAWNIFALEAIATGQEIFVHYLLPGETDEAKIATRQVDIRFSVYIPPDYIDYSSP